MDKLSFVLIKISLTSFALNYKVQKNKKVSQANIKQKNINPAPTYNWVHTTQHLLAYIKTGVICSHF